MPDQYLLYLTVVALFIFIVAVIVLPLRLRHAMTMRLHIEAPAERVWHVLTQSMGARSWRPEVVEIRPDTDDPELVTHICRYRDERLAIVMRVLERVPCERLIMRCERIGSNCLPLGGRAYSAIKLTETDDGTRLAFREEGRFASLLSFWLFALAQRASLRRLKCEAEGRKPGEAARSQSSSPTPLMVAGSVAAASAIAVLMGWQIGMLVFAFLCVMEYGHVLVLRYAGERPSFATLLPFVGGAVAMGGHRRSAYDDAVQALSGPAALTGLIVALTILSALTSEVQLADNFRAAAGIAAVIVALFLLPFYPLNGGWLFNTLRANMPVRAFQVPAVLVTGFVLCWSMSAGQVIVAGISAGLMYELLVPLRSGVTVDRSLSSQSGLMIAGIYVSMNLIAYTAMAMFLVS